MKIIRDLFQSLLVHGVIHPFAILPPVHDPRFDEDPHVVRQGGLCKVHLLKESAGTEFTVAEELDDPQTVLIPDSVFYEFKPKEAKNYNSLLTLDQLEIGRSYELVVSTLSGLYRYKTRKTFLVVGRYHDTPTVIIDKE